MPQLRVVPSLAFACLPALACFVAPLTTHAGPPSPTPTTKPMPIQPPAGRIVGVRRGPTNVMNAAGPYTSGPIVIEVEVANSSSTSALATRVLAGRDGSIASVPVNVPPDGRTWVRFADPVGLTNGCFAKTLPVTLENALTSSTIIITPNCTFSARAVDPEAGMSPDLKLARRRGRLYFHSARLSSALACGNVEVRATLRNDGAAPATSAFLSFDGQTRNRSEEALVPIAPGSERAATFTGAFSGEARSHGVTIMGDGVPLYQTGWNLDVARTCSPTLTLR
jgi:hypothetical protein